MISSSPQSLTDTIPGVLLIDKPAGMTSHDVVNRVRNITGIKRIGHAGTLDPLATGLLIVLVGREFTKQQPTFLKQDKSYECLVKLGFETDTYDRQGVVVLQTEWPAVASATQSQIAQVLPRLTGEITQTVPAFSAIKIAGQELYKQARRGTLDVSTLPQRQVVVSELTMSEFNCNHQEQSCTFKLHLSCSSGTYVRSLVHELGVAVGVGATVMELRRTRIGTYTVDQAILLANLALHLGQK